jgi:Fic family protein
MNDTINTRQLQILTLLSNHKAYSRQQIQQELHFTVSDVTIIRDLNNLLSQHLLSAKGTTKQKTYWINTDIFLWPCDINTYFLKEADQRQNSPLLFRHTIFKKPTVLLTTTENQQVQQWAATFAQRLSTERDDIGFQKELERICIDLSWKSSQIEGNTYTLLETEELILYNKEAEGHSKQESRMILNHKDAFTFIINNADRFKKPTKQDLLELHTILVNGLGIDPGIRTSLVGVRGTAYRPLDNKWQLTEAIDNMLTFINSVDSITDKAIFAHAITAYIQAFKDGNKRTSRMFSNAILMASNIPPLSYRNVHDQEYKKAMLLFYETNNLTALKQMMMEQCQFTAEHYF